MTPTVQRLNLRRPDGTLTDLGNVLVAGILGVFLGATVSAVVFIAAAQADAPGAGRQADTEWVQLPDGRSVLCVVDGSGFDCDWAGASLEGEP